MPRLLLTSALLLPSQRVLSSTPADRSSDGQRAAAFGNRVAAQTSLPRGTRLHFHRRRVGSFLRRHFPSSLQPASQTCRRRGEEQEGEETERISISSARGFRPAGQFTLSPRFKSDLLLLFAWTRSVLMLCLFIYFSFIYCTHSHVCARGDGFGFHPHKASPQWCRVLDPSRIFPLLACGGRRAWQNRAFVSPVALLTGHICVL